MFWAKGEAKCSGPNRNKLVLSEEQKEGRCGWRRATIGKKDRREGQSRRDLITKHLGG